MGRYGSGSVYQRGKQGIWYYQAYVDGKQVGPKSSGSTNRKDAERELNRLLGKKARGELSFNPTEWTIEQIVADYLLHAQQSLSEKTVIDYRCYAAKQLVPAFGRLKPDKLTVAQLRAFRKKRLSDGVADTTINRELSLLRAALNYALKHNAAMAFRVPPFPMVREDNARTGFAREADIHKLVSALPYIGLKALGAASYYTGVRRGELLKLDWHQIDFPGKVIRVYKTKNHQPREVPILDGLMLQTLLDAKAERDAYFPECEAVFCYNGKRLDNPKKAWKTAINAAGLEGLRFHDLRRSANRNMRDLGVPQGIRMSIMGHKTPSQDLRYGIVDRADLDVVRGLFKKRDES